MVQVALGAATLDGEPLPIFELLSYFLLLVVAGNETTRNATSGGVQALIDDGVRRDSTQELLRGCFYLERIAQKIRFRRAGPRELGSLRRTLEVMRPLPGVAPTGLRRCIERIGRFDALNAALHANA